MNPGVLKDNEDADNQHNVAYNLGNGVLERTIESTLCKQPVKEKALRSRGDPKNRNQERDQQKNLKQAQLDRRKSGIPSQGNSGGIYRTNGEKDDQRQTQNGRDNSDEIDVNLETAKKPANRIAL
jgi:hypothetical protein